MTESKGNKVELEREKVDNYIITSCITLIGAFIIILSIKKPTEAYISYSYLISLLFLIISLLFSLWHKFRFPVRQQMFEQEKDRLISNISSEIADFAEEFVLPAAQMKFNQARLKYPDLSEDEIKKKSIDEEAKGKTKKVIVTHLEKLNYQMKEKSDEIFRKPLNERYSKLKFRIDILSKTFRYWAFGIAIIFFFSSIFLTII